LILTEAIIGAALVLLKLVERDQSALRAASMCVHLMNTFLLLGAVALSADWAGKKNPKFLRIRSIERSGGLGILLLLFLGSSGAVTALGDTLFPSSSLAAGLAQDFGPARHFLLELRIYHPIIALCVSLYLVMFARWIIRRPDLVMKSVWPEKKSRLLLHTSLVLVLQCAQLLLGVLNVLFLAPIWIQMSHLFCSDLIWINFVLLLSTLLVVETS